MSERIESAEEFVEEFLWYRLRHSARSRKRPEILIKPKRPGPKPKCTVEELRRMYLDEGKMAKEIAAMYKMSESGVRGMLKRHGIKKEKQNAREKSEQHK